MQAIALELIRGPSGAIVGLIPLDVNTIRRVVDDNGGDFEYVQVLGGRPVAHFRAHEMIVVPVGDAP